MPYYKPAGTQMPPIVMNEKITIIKGWSRHETHVIRFLRDEQRDTGLRWIFRCMNCARNLVFNPINMARSYELVFQDRDANGFYVGSMTTPIANNSTIKLADPSIGYTTTTTGTYFTPSLTTPKENSNVFEILTVETIDGTVGQVLARINGNRVIVWQSEPFTASVEDGKDVTAAEKASKAAEDKAREVLKDVFNG